MAWPPISLSADKELAHYVLEDESHLINLGFNRESALGTREGIRQIAQVLYERLTERSINYALERFEADRRIQHVRAPEAILNRTQEGTCLDLALLFAGLALGKELVPLLVVLDGHALVAVSLEFTRRTADSMARSSKEGKWVDEGLLQDAETLRALIDNGGYIAIECTGFAVGNTLQKETPEGAGRINGLLGFDAAEAAGRAQLDYDSRPFRFAIDVAVLRDRHAVLPYDAPPLAGATTPYRHRLERLMAKETLFGGRDLELAWLDDAVTARPSGHTLVTGPSGCGKTALLVNWVRQLLERRPQNGKDLPPKLAYVFINRDAELAEQAVMHLLYHQLIRVHGRREDVPRDLPTLEQRCVELLETPLQEGGRLIVVIDGLDEAEAQGWKPEFLLPRSPLEGMHFVFSAREMGSRDWVRWLSLDAGNVRTKRLSQFDFKAVGALLRSAPGGLAQKAGDEAFVQALLDVSEGDPFYLKFLIEDLASAEAAGIALDVAAVAAKPVGLAYYLKGWWTDLAQGAADKCVQNLLGILVVADGSLSRAALLEIDPAGPINSYTVDGAIDKIRRYLIGDDDAGYSISHPRLREYIKKSCLSPADLQNYANALAAWCERAWPDQNQPYALEHVIARLCDQRLTLRPEARPAQTARMCKIVCNAEFRTRRKRDLDGIALDERDFTVVLRALVEDGPANTIRMIVETAFALFEARRSVGDRAANMFHQSSLGNPSRATKLLQYVAPEGDWRSAALFVCAGLCALTHPERARAFMGNTANDSRSEGFDPTLRLLGERVRDALAPDPTKATPRQLPYPPFTLPMDRVDAETVRAIVVRMGGGGDAERIAAHIDPSMIGTLLDESADARPVFLAERDSRWLVAFLAQADFQGNSAEAVEADGLIKSYVAAHALNPYRQYRNRSLWAVLGAVLCLPDTRRVFSLARAVCEAALNPVSVDYREALQLALLGLGARHGDAPQRLELDERVVQARSAAERLHPTRSEADTWGAHCRRLAALAEVTALCTVDQETPAELLDLARHLPFGYAGFQAMASLALADAHAVCRTKDQTAIHESLEAAARSAHNVQESKFCALTTARVNAIRLRWFPGRVADVAGVVERFGADPFAPEFAPVHMSGERYELRASGEHMLPIPAVSLQARTLADIALNVYGLKPGQLSIMNPVAGDAPEMLNVPDRAFAPLLAARLSAEILGRRAEFGDDAAYLIARLVPVATADATALDLVLARLALSVDLADSETIASLSALAPKDWMEAPLATRGVEARGLIGRV
ncbi:ATP-binding protein [Variovorax sp. J22R133]|uniref:ATP-binding protein n=1 Tax=Variovorax brevis TaxID=3053503 RepID=UPI0025771763|nr:ATP-binding protein [Variovorax sp. J22R133]MDM0118015.1 ATP-binding protein [Variovorax sp. J22R133]